MADGGLRNTFRTWLPEFHFQAIESALTGGGIPDLNGCYDGAEFWVETKWTQGFVVEVRTKQAVWIKRRVLAGGRAFIAVRRSFSLPRPGRRPGRPGRPRREAAGLLGRGSSALGLAADRPDADGPALAAPDREPGPVAVLGPRKTAENYFVPGR
jgi:hypothetical protein